MSQPSFHIAGRRTAPIGDIMPGDVESLKVELAGFKGEVLTELKHLAHDVKNVAQGMSAFVTRREVDEIHERRRELHTALEARVEKLEALVYKIAWAIFLAWLGGLAVSAKVYLGH